MEETNYLYRFHNTNTIKQVSENEEKKDIEVKSVLSGFLSNILMGNVKNPILKNIHMLDYFFELIPDEYSSYLWKKLRKKEIYGV